MLFFMLMSCPLIGQGIQQKQIAPEDYSSWGKLFLSELSEKGNWVSYKMTYEEGNDTLFIQNTKTATSYKIPKGSSGIFVKEEVYMCLRPDKKGVVIDLRNGKQNVLENVNDVELIEKTKMIILKNQENDGTLQLKINSLATNKTTIEINHVSAYAVNPNQTEIIYSSNSNNSTIVSVLNLQTLKTKTLYQENTNDYFINFVWQRDGKSVTFSKQEKLNQPLPSKGIYFYNLVEQKIKKLNPAKLYEVTHDYDIQGFYRSSIAISESENVVYIACFSKNKTKDTNQNSEVWNALNKEIGTRRDNLQKSALLSWNTDTEQIFFLGKEDDQILQLNENQNYLLTYTETNYKPTIKSESDVDIMLIDIKTGKRNVILTEFPGNFSTVNCSPNGQYITYFSKGNWCIYDVKNEKHTNLTQNSQTDFSEEVYSAKNNENSAGFVGWSINNQSFFVYDKFDVWEITLLPSQSKRVTKGKEQSIVYRVVKEARNKEQNKPFFSKKTVILDVSQPILVKGEAADYSKEGYFWLSKEKLTQATEYGSFHLSNLLSAKKQLIYTKEKYNLPKQLIFKSGNSKEKILFQSNSQYKKYQWGHSELIKYTNSKGEVLNGVLFYPINFNPSQKYPMVVRIYENLAFTQHLFTMPSYRNSDGFNKTIYTSQGYFVFSPDIKYEIGNPGYSALDCVVSGTKAVVNKGNIQEKEIGLIGHSFGGYESFFIATQSNLFAAIVTGAGVADLTSCYFTFGKSYNKPETWRFEFAQMRMGKSFFEDKISYYNNSPITHLDKVNTPILSWTGSNDLQVNPEQTMNFHMGMRRLKKEHIMLQIPNEGHVILNPQNQKDLTIKIKEWFDYHLRKGLKPLWSEPN